MDKKRVCRNCVYWINRTCQKRSSSAMDPDEFACDLFEGRE